jgi:hypothetical protein
MSRYVVFGLAVARSAWFDHVSGLANAGAVPVEFVKCVSASEVAGRLRAGQVCSAVVADEGATGVDRDLVEIAASAGVPVVLVGPGRVTSAGFGVAAHLTSSFTGPELVDTLKRLARPAAEMATRVATPAPQAPEPSPDLAPLVAVTGPGGTGASTVAIALAQGLASRRAAGAVLLADLARRADHALLHATPDVVPGLPEAVDTYRSTALDRGALRSLTFRVDSRGYDVLLGVRRAHDWAAMRPRAFEATIAGLRQAWSLVVADIDGDLEGYAETGSTDIEERNHAARLAVANAAAIVVVGAPTAKGIHSLLRSVTAVVGAGAEPGRLIPVVNAAPRSRWARAELTRTVRDLVQPRLSSLDGIGAVVHLPWRRAVEPALRDVTGLPSEITRPVTAVVESLLAGPGGVKAPAEVEPLAVRPGTLGLALEGVGA